MAEAHAGMGLTDAHFDAVAGHFVSTLKELGVAEDLVAEATAVVESTRGQVRRGQRVGGMAWGGVALGGVALGCVAWGGVG
jgi:truncated hemoglobin YjbI